MKIYRTFLKIQIRNYLLGSAVAVLAIGSLILFASLEIGKREYLRLLAVLLLSFLVMAVTELRVFLKQIRPIRVALCQSEPALSELEGAYEYTHRLPKHAVLRIMGPHLVGFDVPALVLSLWMIHAGYLNIPYEYVWFAIFGSVVVASMHALIEFFLNSATIIPLVNQLRERALVLYNVDFSLEGHVFVPIRPKFLISCMLIGTFPLLLFIIAMQIHLDHFADRLQGVESFWIWAGLMLTIGVIFSWATALLLTRSVQQPIDELYKAMNKVREGELVQVQDQYSDEFSKLVAGFNMMVRSLQAREQQSRQMLDSYFTTLAVALDARDSYTAGHSLRVAEYSVIIGQLAGLNGQKLDDLRKSALLHDIGKIGVPDSVLFKEGSLTEEEFNQIKSHPVLGEKILRQIESVEKMEPYLSGVRSHHERYDGKGYPDGLAGPEIPLHGRIIAVADAYDAMTSDRPYRQGMNHERALQILEQGRGTQWDPELAGLLLSYFGKRPASEDSGTSGRMG